MSKRTMHVFTNIHWLIAYCGLLLDM